MLQETHLGDCHCVASGLVAYRRLSKPEMNGKCYTCPVHCYAALGCFWKSQTTLRLCCGNYCLHWSVLRFHRNEECAMREKHFWYPERNSPHVYPFLCLTRWRPNLQLPLMRDTMCQIPLAAWLNYSQHIMRFVDAKKHTAVSCNIKTTHRWSKYKLLNISKHNWHCSVLQCSFALIWMLLLRVPATLSQMGLW